MAVLCTIYFHFLHALCPSVIPTKSQQFFAVHNPARLPVCFMPSAHWGTVFARLDNLLTHPSYCSLHPFTYSQLLRLFCNGVEFFVVDVCLCAQKEAIASQTSLHQLT